MVSFRSIITWGRSFNFDLVWDSYSINFYGLYGWDWLLLAFFGCAISVYVGFYVGLCLAVHQNSFLFMFIHVQSESVYVRDALELILELISELIRNFHTIRINRNIFLHPKVTLSKMSITPFWKTHPVANFRILRHVRNRFLENSPKKEDLGIKNI